MVSSSANGSHPLSKSRGLHHLDSEEYPYFQVRWGGQRFGLLRSLDMQYILRILFLTLVFESGAQELIKNGSFEGVNPLLGRSPPGWYICDELSTPDIQPITSSLPASHGQAYLGLVARAREPGNPELNGTTEAISQTLRNPLSAGGRYKIGLELRNDPDHIALGKNLGSGGVLQISISRSVCSATRRILWISEIVDYSSWTHFEIEFLAECDERYIELECGFGDTIRHNLNYVMVDNISLTALASQPGDTIDCIPMDSMPVDTMMLVDSMDLDTMYAECQLFLPNSFTPNGDGINDIYEIYGDCPINEYQLSIFNRWGQVVFESQDIDQNWSGYIDGDPAAQDIYMCQVRFRYFDTNGKQRSGLRTSEIILIR